MGNRIVITSFGSYGDVFPYLGLALGLRARGHEPVLAMPAFYRSIVESLGLGFHAVRPDVDPRDRETVARIMDRRAGTEFIVRELVIGSLRQSFEDLTDAATGADLLVTHPITFAGPLVAESTGLPWASTVLAPMSFFSVHDLPVFPPAPWMKRLEALPGAARTLVGMTRLMTRRWTGPVRAFRRELGLSRAGDPVLEGQHSPRLVLALFSRVLAEPQIDWPPQVRITGAIPYDGKGAAGELSPRLREFLAAGDPPVVFTLGSSAVGVAGDFYRESVEVVRRLGRRAVLLVGPHADNRRGIEGEDLLLEEFAPHASLFPAGAAIVHQGGVGTLHQGLRSGRPTLVVPHAHDQPDNAHRVKQLGTSLTIPAERYTAKRATDALRALLTDPAYAARAAEIGARVRAEDGVASACDAIEALLQESGR